jgi:hypothetical protein
MGQDGSLAPLEEALEDAHQFLHACARGYHDPPAFRRNLHSFIQAARNISFRLQSLKSSIPEFESWYSSWQDYLRAEPTLRWVNQARTKVVKRRGLAARSKARYSLTYSYDQPVDELVEVPAETPTAKIVQQAIGRVPHSVRNRVLVTIEREWVAEDLPDRELPTTMRRALLVLVALVEEADKASSGDARTTSPEEAASHWHGQ